MLWEFKGRRSGTVGEIRKGFMERTVFEMDSKDGKNFSQQLGEWRNRRHSKPQRMRIQKKLHANYPGFRCYINYVTQ